MVLLQLRTTQYWRKIATSKLRSYYLFGPKACDEVRGCRLNLERGGFWEAIAEYTCGRRILTEYCPFLEFGRLY